MGAKASKSYSIRKGGTNKNRLHYTQKLLGAIKKDHEEVLHAFGYVADPRDPKTANFMDYEGRHS